MSDKIYFFVIQCFTYNYIVTSIAYKLSLKLHICHATKHNVYLIINQCGRSYALDLLSRGYYLCKVYVCYTYCIRTAPSQTRKQSAHIFAKCIFAQSSFRAAAKNKRLHVEIISTRHNYLEKQFRECIKPEYYFVEISTIENILRETLSLNILIWGYYLI